jgi:type VI secretion system secreted protein VgrG
MTAASPSSEIPLTLRDGTISFEYAPPAGVEGQTLLVRSFVGQEAVSQLYELEIELFQRARSGRVAEVHGAEIVGRPATLTLVPAVTRTAQPTFFSGIIRRFEVRSVDGFGARYRAWLVPQVWRLTQGQNSRIFQDKTVREIVEQLLGASYRCRFEPSVQPPRRPYCVQYAESDWSFIARLLADEGLSYIFEQRTEGEGLRIVQHAVEFPSIAAYSEDPGVPCCDSSGMKTDDEHINELAVRRQIRPGRHTTRDQIFDLPWPVHTVTAPAEAEPLEVYEYIGQPKGETPLSADRAAFSVSPAHSKMRLEELRWPEVQLVGQGCCQGFTAGRTFQLAPWLPADELGGRADEILPHDLLLTTVTHQGRITDDESSHKDTYAYGNRFACIPAKVQLRPARLPRPTIPGVQSAVVVGPRASSTTEPPGAVAGDEEIYPDALGRVKVQFPWDREGRHNELSSCWVPVMQAWAGPRWGAIFIPRIGQQVIVHFVDGDPDQPIIIGQIYHEQNLPPYELPRHKTRSTIMTASSPGQPGQPRGHNELRFEDRAGAEELYIRAQLDRNDLVQHDYTVTVGHDQRCQVNHDYEEFIDGKYWQVVGVGLGELQIAKTVQVLGHQEEIIKGEVRYQAIGPSRETIEQARIVSVGSLDETVKGSRKITVEQGKASLTVKAAGYEVDVADAIAIESKHARIAATAKDGIELTSAPDNARASRVQVLPDQLSLRLGEAVVQLTKMGITLRFTDDNYIHLSEKGITIKGSAVEITGAQPVRIN